MTVDGSKMTLLTGNIIPTDTFRTIIASLLNLLIVPFSGIRKPVAVDPEVEESPDDCSNSRPCISKIIRSLSKQPLTNSQSSVYLPYFVVYTIDLLLIVISLWYIPNT